MELKIKNRTSKFRAVEWQEPEKDKVKQNEIPRERKKVGEYIDFEEID
ncbi:MAG TPA: hypothetical protein VKY82_10195 [Flavobacterium sp.]|nr:hypothetical protein [Flavobacterium sp.]